MSSLPAPLTSFVGRVAELPLRDGRATLDAVHPIHLRAMLGNLPRNWIARQSTLVENADMRSGTVNIDLAANSGSNTVVGQVGGTWRCPPNAF